MNTQEQKRVMVLNRVEQGQLTAVQAAEVLGVCERHVRRLLAAYRKEGEARLAHGNRGRQPIHTIGQEVRQRVIELATSTYQGCNQQHLRDLLQEREGIRLSREPCASHPAASRTAEAHPSVAQPNIVAVAPATPKRACCCKLMAVSIAGWKNAAPI